MLDSSHPLPPTGRGAEPERQHHCRDGTLAVLHECVDMEAGMCRTVAFVPYDDDEMLRLVWRAVAKLTTNAWTRGWSWTLLPRLLMKRCSKLCLFW